MKKTFSILSMILLGCALYAGPVTPEKALQVAQSVFASAPGTKAVGESELKIVWDGEFEPATKAAQDPAFYVVSRPEGGFVMVAGNDNVQPVLAFSFDNDFVVEGMPDNVRWWMEELKGYARSAVRPTPEITEAWGAYVETKSVISVDEVESQFTASLTNLWDQSGPANHFAPTVAGQSKSVCGCVPLALAEIMAWFGGANADEFTEATIAGYSYNAYTPATQKFTQSNTISPHDLSTTHSWAALKSLCENSAFRNASVEENGLGLDLGRLVYDIGTILQVKYNQNEGAGGTSGNLGLLNRLTSMMRYNQAAMPKRRENFTSSEWISMLVAEISEHPVFYEGQDIDNKGGHAFVADGYATMKVGGNKVIHFNFGWGGSCNGYYNCLTDVETANGYNFFSGNSALFGFAPDNAGTTTPIQKTEFFFDGETGGLTLKQGTSITDANVYLVASNLINSGSTQFTGNVSLFRVNYTGAPVNNAIVTYSISEDNDFKVGVWFPTFDIENVPSISAPVLGDKYALFYKETGSSDYKAVDGGSSGNVLAELPVYPFAFIKREASYSKNDYFVFALTNHGYRYGDAVWTVTPPEGEPQNYSQNDHQVQLTQVGVYKISCTTPNKETVVTYIDVTPATP